MSVSHATTSPVPSSTISIPSSNNTPVSISAGRKPPSRSPLVYPPQYSFPPFYTLQPNQTTRASQLTTWTTLLLAYAAAHNLFRLSTSDAIFHNATLNRRLAPEDAKTLFEHMVAQGRAEFVSGAAHPAKQATSMSAATSAAASAVESLLGTASSAVAASASSSAQGPAGGAKEEIYVFWRSLEDWFGEVDAWISDTGQRNTVLTVWELAEGDASSGRSWEGMPGDMFGRCLRVGVKRGKAVLFGSEESGLGIKFV